MNENMKLQNSNGRKRKKRKTRKCLDEIRKRSRIIDENDNQSALHYPRNTFNASTNLNPNNLTETRLTLATLPKAIRSETITRPALVEISHKPLNLNDIINSRTETKIITEKVYSSDEILSVADSVISSCSTNMNELPSRSPERPDGNSPVGVDMCTPRSYQFETDIFLSSNPERIPLKSETMNSASHDSQTCQATLVHIFQTKFMHELAENLKQKMPMMLKDNCMEKDISLFKKLYIEDRHQECEENVQSRLRNKGAENNNHLTDRGIRDTYDVIVQNPREYLKLGYLPHYTANKELHGTLESNSNTETSLSTISPYQSLIQYSPPSHSMVPYTPRTLSQLARQTLVQDTPEYIYYAHKLNQ